MKSKVGFCEVKVNGAIVEVVSHELGSDAAMATRVWGYCPFVSADVAELQSTLGSGAMRFFDEPVECAPGVRYLDGAE